MSSWWLSESEEEANDGHDDPNPNDDCLLLSLANYSSLILIISPSAYITKSIGFHFLNSDCIH